MMLPFPMDWPSFVAGFLTAVVIAAIVTAIGWAGRQMGAPMRPMTVVLTTNRTPWQVSMGSTSATLLVIAVAVLVGVAVGVVFLGASLAELWWALLIAAAAFALGLLDACDGLTIWVGQHGRLSLHME